jgi:type I restriction enzyme S subunit
VTYIDRVRVGDVLRIERIPVQPDPMEEYVAIGVRSFGRGIFHYEPAAGDKLGSLRFFAVNPDRLVVSNIKGWEGAIAVSAEVDAGCVASNRFLIYDALDHAIDVSWARWFFLSQPGLELIQRASPGSADRNRTLAVQRFEELVIPLPPRDVQKRQARFLDEVSARASATAQVLTDRGTAVVVEALPPIVDELVTSHSSGWARLDELVELTSDIIHPGDDPGDAREFIGLQHVESHTGRRLGSDGIEGLKGRKFRFRAGDIIYGYLRPYLNKVWVADRPGLCSVDQYVLRPRAGTNAELLAHILRGQAVLDRAIELTHSLQLPRLRSGLLMSLEVPVLQPAEATELAHRLVRVRDLVVDLVARREHQRRTAEALIPAALNSVFGPQ